MALGHFHTSRTIEVARPRVATEESRVAYRIVYGGGGGGGGGEGGRVVYLQLKKHPSYHYSTASVPCLIFVD